MLRRSRVVACCAVVAGILAGVLLLQTDLRTQAEPGAEFSDSAEFLKRGRPELAIGVRWGVGGESGGAKHTGNVEEAIAANKDALWRNTFLEFERIRVEEPCPKGPPVGSASDIGSYLAQIDVVDDPSPYIVFVHVVGDETLKTLDELNLGRIVPQEYVDGSPGSPGGYEQVSAALHVTEQEFEDIDLLGRYIAEALGCTEACSGPPQ